MNPEAKKVEGYRTVLSEVKAHQKAGKPVWDWFAKRIKTHGESMGGGGSNPLMPPANASAIMRALDDPREQSTKMLYLHIPYCPSVCTFCAFFRQALGKADLQEYVEGVIRQIERYSKTKWAKSSVISAVYFGGGTPTVLPAEQLVVIIQALRRSFLLNSKTEITIESRLHGVDEDYWKPLVSEGVTRVSFGVQTFRTDIRRSLGRVSNTVEIERSIKAAKRSGVPVVSVDLIYNLPGQTEESWMDDLRRVNVLPVSGTSLYSLIPFPKSTMMKRIEGGLDPPLPGLDNEFHLFSLAEDIMAENGWKRFSPSHYGRVSEETNVYNSGRSVNVDILGMGSSGGGRIGKYSYMNSFSVTRYLEDQKNGVDSHAMVMVGREDSLLSRQFFALTDAGGLRLDGSWKDLYPNVFQLLGELVNMDLLEKKGEYLTLTRSGRFWAYNLGSLLSGAMGEDFAPPINSNGSEKEQTDGDKKLAH